MVEATGGVIEQRIKIRQAVFRDAAAVHAAIASAKDEIPLRVPESNDFKGLIGTTCRDQSTWVAEIDGEFAGAIIMAVNENFSLVTLKEFRGRGVTRALIRWAVATTKRRHTCHVVAKAWEENAPVRKLFEGEGFRIDPYNQPPRPRRRTRPHFIN